MTRSPPPPPKKRALKENYLANKYYLLTIIGWFVWFLIHPKGIKAWEKGFNRQIGLSKWTCSFKLDKGS